MTVSFKRLMMVLMAFTAMFALSACQDDIEQSAWDELIISQSNETLFFVYAYTETCPDCVLIKDDIDAFKASNAMAIELILVDVESTTVPTPEDRDIPRIYVVQNHEIVSIHTGIDDVRALFASVEQGVFLSWDELIISQSNETLFFVYAYTETCPACISIRDDIAAFKASNAMDIEMIAVDVHQVDESIEYPEGLAVPRVYVVYNGEITEYKTGVSDVLALFASVESETFTP